MEGTKYFLSRENLKTLNILHCYSTRLWVEHDLRSSVPTSGNVLCEETSVIVVGISHTSQTKVTDLQKNEKGTRNCHIRGHNIKIIGCKTLSLHSRFVLVRIYDNIKLFNHEIMMKICLVLVKPPYEEVFPVTRKISEWGLKGKCLKTSI